MAAGDPDDVLRSLRRFVWQTLAGGAPADQTWTVRTQRSRVADDERPVAIVEPASALTTPHARAARDQGDVQKARTFSVVCYTVVEGTAAASSREARRVEALLDAGLTRGLVTTDVPPVDIGGPYRLPVYDFAGVAVEGPDRAGPAEPYMHAAIALGMTVQVIQDAMDELRYTVVANVPVSWWAGGRIPPAAPLATGGLVDDGWLPGFKPVP